MKKLPLYFFDTFFGVHEMATQRKPDAVQTASLDEWAAALVAVDRDSEGSEPIVKLVSEALGRLAGDRRLKTEDREFAEAQLAAIKRAARKSKIRSAIRSAISD
jgi:hypothetical protein